MFNFKVLAEMEAGLTDLKEELSKPDPASRLEELKRQSERLQAISLSLQDHVSAVSPRKWDREGLH